MTLSDLQDYFCIESLLKWNFLYSCTATLTIFQLLQHIMWFLCDSWASCPGDYIFGNSHWLLLQNVWSLYLTFAVKLWKVLAAFFDIFSRVLKISLILITICFVSRDILKDRLRNRGQNARVSIAYSCTTLCSLCKLKGILYIAFS